MAAARANRRLGVLDASIWLHAIEAAAQSRCGRAASTSTFPLTIWQTGSGTQTNMNANEVIANRANERLGRKPLGSRADSPQRPRQLLAVLQRQLPTVMHIAAVLALRARLLPALRDCTAKLAAKARRIRRYCENRSHTSDGCRADDSGADISTRSPVRSPHGGRAHREDTLTAPFRSLPQGGTAVGTQASCADRFRRGLLRRSQRADRRNLHAQSQQVRRNGLARRAGRGVRCSQCGRRFSSQDRKRHPVPRLRVRAAAWASFVIPPRRSHLVHHARQAEPDDRRGGGAGRVPGDGQPCHGNGSGTGSGNFELNVAKPVLIYNLLQSIRVLADSAAVFARRLVHDLDVDRERLESNVANALLLATALNPVLGYDKVAQITAKALQ